LRVEGSGFRVEESINVPSTSGALDSPLTGAEGLGIML